MSSARRPRKSAGTRWSARVTRGSDALDLEPAVFKKKTAREIARSLKRSAEKSTRRKSSPYRSAMSMLTFYVNRAGRNLPASRLKVLNDAKDELRQLYGRPAKSAATRRARSPARKRPQKTGRKASRT